MSTQPNPNTAASVSAALVAGAGMSESTVEAQHVKAIAVLTGKVAADSNEAANITTALAILNGQLAHIRTPGTKGGA